jgi:hypothetical protein
MTSFRVALTCLSISAMLVTIFDWLSQHPFERPRGQPVVIRYALQHSSSPRVLICIASIVLLGAVQIILAWRTPLARHWWAPLLAEIGLCVAFAITYHQVFGGFGFGCGQSLASCVTRWPQLIEGSECVVFAGIGLSLGLAWSFVGQRGHVLAPG